MIFVIVSVIGAGKSKSVDHFIFCVRRNASRSLLVHSNQPADQPTSQPASQPTSLPTPMIDCTWWERVLEHVPVCPCLFEVSVPTSTRARALVSRCWIVSLLVRRTSVWVCAHVWFCFVFGCCCCCCSCSCGVCSCGCCVLACGVFLFVDPWLVGWMKLVN